MLGAFHVFRVWRAVRFLFMAPFILLMLVVINWMTTPGQWWVQWAALGIGIAWFASLFRVIRAAVILGGIAALVAYLSQRKSIPPGQA
jgi:hypothetical protein